MFPVISVQHSVALQRFTNQIATKLSQEAINQHTYRNNSSMFTDNVLYTAIYYNAVVYDL